MQTEKPSRFYKFNFCHTVSKRNSGIILEYILKSDISLNEPHVHNTKQVYLQLDNSLQFMLHRIRTFLNAETNIREKMRKTLNKYITARGRCSISETLVKFLNKFSKEQAGAKATILCKTM